MFSHVMLGISDFERALGFYRPLMQVLGHVERFCEPAYPSAAWQGSAGGRPLFIIGRPFDGAPAQAGNGQMTAFQVDRRMLVDAAHAAALAHGGRCEGPPGLRPHYHAHYYGAYSRDPDGNKLGVACHEPA